MNEMKVLHEFFFLHFLGFSKESAEKWAVAVVYVNDVYIIKILYNGLDDLMQMTMYSGYIHSSTWWKILDKATNIIA